MRFLNLLTALLFILPLTAANEYIYVYTSEGVIIPVETSNLSYITYEEDDTSEIKSFYARYAYGRSAGYGISSLNNIEVDNSGSEVTMNVNFKTFYNALTNANAVIFKRDAEPVLAVKTDDVTHGTARATRKSDGAYTMTATPTYPYEFDHWSDNGSTLTPRDTTIYEDCTVTAFFQNSKYRVTFVNSNGDELETQWVEFGETPQYTGIVPAIPPTAQYSYTFAGWEPDIEPVTADVIYTAKYSSALNKYSARFVNEDGTELQNSILEYGQTPVYSGIEPTKQSTAQYSYTFVGWEPGIEPITTDVIYTAKYSSTLNKYSVRFVNEDGTELQSSILEYGQTPVYSGTEPIKQSTAQYSYKFTGWEPDIESVTKEVTYIAVFLSEIRKYPITFLNYDNTVLQNTSFDYGTTPVYDEEIPQKEATPKYSYTFNGWSPDVKTVTGVASYVAVYSESINKYEITFLNYDNTVLQQIMVEYGETPVYTEMEPQRPSTAQYSYKFSKWEPSVTSVEKSAVYTAGFESVINKYNVTTTAQHGTTTGDGVYEYGSVALLTAVPDNKYEFVKWSNEATELQIKVTVVSDTALTAYFRLIPSEERIHQVNDTVCVGEEVTFMSGRKTVINQYTELDDVVEQIIGEDYLIRDIYEYKIWTREKIILPMIEPVPQAVWGDKLRYSDADIAIDEFLVENKTRLWPEITSKWWEFDTGNGFEAYKDQIIPKQDKLSIRYVLSTVCEPTVTSDALSLNVETPNPANTPQCSGHKSVNKFDWLLMLNVRALREQGYELSENDVVWYKVVGDRDSFNENDDDEMLCRGFYYTIDKSLRNSGGYYCLVNLPNQRGNVECLGILGTDTIFFSDEGGTRMGVVPTLLHSGESFFAENLPIELESTLVIYDTKGRVINSQKTIGEPSVSLSAPTICGEYIVKILSADNEQTFKLIVK